MISHERDLDVGLNSRARADRQCDRSEAVGAAVYEIAEKEHDPLLPQLRLGCGLVEERLQEIRPSVDVADSEHLDVRRERRAAKYRFRD